VVAGGGGGRRRGRWPPTGVLALAAEQRRCSLPQGPCVLRLRVPAMWMEWEAARVGIGSGGVAGWVADFIRWAGWARWAAGPRAGTWAASCLQFSCRAGPALWAEIAAQPSPMSCSCRPRPDNIVLGSCSCRAKKSCFGPTHGPRAFWPSIGAGAAETRGAHELERGAAATSPCCGTGILADPFCRTGQRERNGIERERRRRFCVKMT
jgi:hypothetical protein